MGVTTMTLTDAQVKGIVDARCREMKACRWLLGQFRDGAECPFHLMLREDPEAARRLAQEATPAWRIWRQSNEWGQRP
jgi:hypothetical protein